ncbi:GNAT family N-acetyltransferase [Noviherbaspirillum soli]|uniref:GNAT family N-acetyltransferase n=1 Tax=Noviherbaspirillum soli TaxID=1064518 RepID=UPI002B268E00|nr:GNAT family N-acetyltransferase [Noviherbaspirillum soli]
MFDYQESKTYLEPELNGQDAKPEVTIRQVRVEQPDETDAHELDVDERTFQIRLANTEMVRSHASSLIHRMYASRGYTVNNPLQENPHRVTMTISEEDKVIGTITLGIDSPSGLLADEIFKDEVDAYRARGRRVCELTKLAFDPTTRSKTALASLFHIIFIYLRRVQKCTDIFIEVNPRHRRFYERMLGFKKHGPKKMNPRVNAPAYLLCVETDYVEEQIQKMGGTSGHDNAEKSLYPYFFCPISEKQNKAAIDRQLAVLHTDQGNANAVNALAAIYQASRGATSVESLTLSH